MLPSSRLGKTAFTGNAFPSGHSKQGSGGHLPVRDPGSNAGGIFRIPSGIPAGPSPAGKCKGVCRRNGKIPRVDKYMQSGGKSFAAAAACFQKEMCPFFSFHEKPGKRSFGFYSFFAPGTLQFCFFVDIRCIQTNSCCFPGLFAPW